MQSQMHFIFIMVRFTGEALGLGYHLLESSGLK